MCLYAWLMSLPFPRFVYTHVKRTAHTHTLTIETAFRLAACANIQCLTCMRPQARFGMAAVTQHTETHTHTDARTHAERMRPPPFPISAATEAWPYHAHLRAVE